MYDRLVHVLEQLQLGNAPSDADVQSLLRVMRHLSGKLQVEDADPDVRRALELMVGDPEYDVPTPPVLDNCAGRRCSWDISRDMDLNLKAAVTDWRWDPCQLDQVDQKRVLSVLAMWLFQHTDLVTCFRINMRKLDRFLRSVEVSFGGCYHDAAHTAFVLHKVHMLFEAPGIKAALTDNEGQVPAVRLALYLTAIVHDYRHMGLNNAFLVATRDPLAVRYNNRSTMENFHAASAFESLGQGDKSFLSTLDPTTETFVRMVVIDCVLATDMQKHFEVLREFERKPDDRAAIMKMCVKCADLGHVAAPLPSHKVWVSKLQEEFYRQGDNEKRRELPVSPLMDRDKRGISASQFKFCEVVAEPLFRSLSTRFPSVTVMHAGVVENMEHWRHVH